MRILHLMCLVFIVFLVLKLTGVAADWSWGWVCSPATVILGIAAREGEIEKALSIKLGRRLDLSDL